MDAYLAEPRISDTELLQAKGPLLYWEAALLTRPRLARMALDFLSAPGQYIYRTSDAVNELTIRLNSILC